MLAARGERRSSRGGLAGRDVPGRTFWAFMGILWVTFAYMIFRQRRHLITLSDDEG